MAKDPKTPPAAPKLTLVEFTSHFNGLEAKKEIGTATFYFVPGECALGRFEPEKQRGRATVPPPGFGTIVFSSGYEAVGINSTFIKQHDVEKTIETVILGRTLKVHLAKSERKAVGVVEGADSFFGYSHTPQFRASIITIMDYILESAHDGVDITEEKFQDRVGRLLYKAEERVRFQDR
jgi:hypothetical protein